jgi:hypothetical protein
MAKKIEKINLVWLIPLFLDLFYLMSYKIIKGTLKKLGELKLIYCEAFYYKALICISDRNLDSR